MIHSLWFRLSITFAVIIVVTVGAIYFLVSQRLAVEVEYYEQISEQYRTDQIQSSLYIHYWEKQSWEGVQSVVEDASIVAGTHIILIGANGTVIADSQGKLLGEYYKPDSPDNPIELTWGPVILGIVYISLDPEAEPYVAPFLGLSTSINRFLLLGGSLAIASL